MEPKNRLIALLRWSEKYTKTDMVYLASGGFWLTLGQVGIGLIAFGISIAFAHLVSKETYGTYQFLLAAFWTIAAFSMTGISSAMARAVARGAEGAYAQAIKPFVLGSLPMALIGLGAAIYYYSLGNPSLAFGMLFIGVVGMFLQPSYIFGSFLEGKRAFKMNALFGILLNAVPAVFLLATMFLTQSPVAFIAVYLCANVATGATLSIVTYFLYRPNKIKDDGLVNLGMHFSANNILSTLAGQADQLALYHFLGPTSVAVYSFATAFPDQAKNLVNAAGTLSFPKFAARPIDEVRRALPYRLILLTLALIFAAGVYWLIAPFLFHIFFPAYSASIWYSRLYGLALIPLASTIQLTVLEAQAAKRELYIMNTIGPIVQIGALIGLIALYGIVGAIIARIIGRTFMLFLGWLLVRERSATARIATP
jgi:O-antigen/teichoic acid export membrane protein